MVQFLIMVVHKKDKKDIPVLNISTTNRKAVVGIVLLAIIIGAVFYFANSHSNKVTSIPKQPVIVTKPKPVSNTDANQTTETVTPPATTPKKKSTGTTSSSSTTAAAVIPDPVVSPQIVTSDRTVSASSSGLTQIFLAEPLDDGFIKIPMTGNNFNFFGTDYGAANSVYWNSNNALVFGETLFDTNTVSLSRNSAPAILIGNYDRLASAFYYSHSTSTDNAFNITKILVKFSNYYTDIANLDAGVYQIRLIKEVAGAKRQWVEVSIISSPPSPGYSNNPSVSYPSGTDVSGNPQDSNGYAIDSTKSSPYNISNGTTFLNLLGSLYSTASPPAGTSFIFQSDELGNTWTFTNNAYLNL